MSEEKNRRAFKRLPAASNIDMWTPDCRWTGTLVNQSLGGIGLTIDSDFSQLTVGEELRIQYDDTEVIGFIRYIRVNDDGSAFMGIAWDQRELPRKESKEHVEHEEREEREEREEHEERKQDAPFFIDGPLDVVCRACVNDEANNTATFKLWDGAEFTEEAETVVTRDIAVRKMQLSTQTLEDIETLLRLYDLGDAECPEEALERLIDFEFTR